MIRKSGLIWLIPAFLLFGTFSLIKANSLNCEGDEAPVQCVLFKEYDSLNEELACQLCAVAIESGKFQQKSVKFCENKDGTSRNCGMISFTYLLTQKRFSEAFDLQYEIFYRDPFGHDERVSTILKKQHIRSRIISWLEQSINDQNPVKYLERAIANLYLDDVNESNNQFEYYLALQGGILDKRTIKLRCRIFQKQGQFNQAYNMLSKYIQEGQKDQRNYTMLEPYLYHLKGNFLMHHLKFNEAIAQFEKASRVFMSFYRQRQFFRGFVFSRFNIGLCYQKMSQHQSAIEKYLQLVKQHIKTAEVLNALGNAFIESAIQQNSQKPNQDKIGRAIFYLSRAIETNPNYYLAHYNLGYAYMKSGQYDKAIQKFIESLHIHKSSQASYGLLTTYFLLNKYQEAKNLITNNITIDKESIDDLLSVCYSYGNLKENSKFYHQVLTQYEHLIKSANGHYWKAMIEFDRDQYGLAIDHFLQAYDKGYNEAHLLFNLAYTYEIIDDHKNACIYYEKAYLKDPRTETKEKIYQCKQNIKLSTPTPTIDQEL